MRTKERNARAVIKLGQMINLTAAGALWHAGVFIREMSTDKILVDLTKALIQTSFDLAKGALLRGAFSATCDRAKTAPAGT